MFPPVAGYLQLAFSSLFFSQLIQAAEEAILSYFSLANSCPTRQWQSSSSSFLSSSNVSFFPFPLHVNEPVQLSAWLALPDAILPRHLPATKSPAPLAFLHISSSHSHTYRKRSWRLVLVKKHSHIHFETRL
jgi:hypothetical protein